MEEVRAIEVIDIEKDIVKELLLFKLRDLHEYLEVISSDIKEYERLQKHRKECIKNLYANLNNKEDQNVKKAKLLKAAALLSNRESIADTQRRLVKDRQRLTELYETKSDLHKERAKYNLIADMYKIMLYK